MESAIAQPEMTFDGDDLYPTIAEKAGALGHSLIQNHPFVDGNKRVGHAAMEVFLVLNGYEITASVDEQEQMVLSVATGQKSRAAFSEWLKQHLIEAIEDEPAPYARRSPVRGPPEARADSGRA